MKNMPPNTFKKNLYFGDNLEVLRKKNHIGDYIIPSESIDLIYLDPPFNSKRIFNMPFLKAPVSLRPKEKDENPTKSSANYGF